MISHCIIPLNKIRIIFKQNIFGLQELLLVLIIDRSPCPDGVHIVGRWCSKTCTESKETIYYVHIWLVTICCTIYCFPSPGVFRFTPPPPPFILQPILVRLRCLRHRLPCPFQINSHLFPPQNPHLRPPASSPSPHRVPEVIA